MKGLNRKVIVVLIVLCLLGIAALLSGCNAGRIEVEGVEFESSTVNIRVAVVDGKKYIWVYGGGITLHHDEVRDD